jgi:hypothetical protein
MRDIGEAIERYEQHKMLEFPWASSIEHVNYGSCLA